MSIDFTPKTKIKSKWINFAVKKSKKIPRNYPFGAMPQHLTAGVTTEQSRLPIAYYKA